MKEWTNATATKRLAAITTTTRAWPVMVRRDAVDMPANAKGNVPATNLDENEPSLFGSR
jgi:hypothetical protein